MTPTDQMFNLYTMFGWATVTGTLLIGWVWLARQAFGPTCPHPVMRAMYSAGWGAAGIGVALSPASHAAWRMSHSLVFLALTLTVVTAVAQLGNDWRRLVARMVLPTVTAVLRTQIETGQAQAALTRAREDEARRIEGRAAWDDRTPPAPQIESRSRAIGAALGRVAGRK